MYIHMSHFRVLHQNQKIKETLKKSLAVYFLIFQLLKRTHMYILTVYNTLPNNLQLAQLKHWNDIGYSYVCLSPQHIHFLCVVITFHSSVISLIISQHTDSQKGGNETAFQKPQRQHTATHLKRALVEGNYQNRMKPSSNMVQNLEQGAFIYIFVFGLS